MIMETRAVYDVSNLEVRQLGGRPRIFGAFPYNALAVLADCRCCCEGKASGTSG